MQTMIELADSAIELTPPVTRIRDQDRAKILQHRGALLQLGEELTQEFYDTLYEHPPTADVFFDGERPSREKTLTYWWVRTVSGPLDADYFSWMALVGLVHVVRGVNNPMMMAMSTFVATFVRQKMTEAGADPAEVDALVEAFRRLNGTVAAVIVHSYDRAVESALFDVAGMPPALLERLRNQQVVQSLSEARRQTGNI